MEINGKPVKDATKQIVFTITEDDCVKGNSKNASSCAAAVAILHSDEKILGVRVHRSITYLEYATHWKRFFTTPALRTELTVYDRARKFEPGTYAISPPYGVHSLEGQQEVERKRKKRKMDARKRHDENVAKRFRHDISNIRPRGANR